MHVQKNQKLYTQIKIAMYKNNVQQYLLVKEIYLLPL